MASAVTVVRNLSFIGFVGGAAVLAMPYVRDPNASTKAVVGLLHPMAPTPIAPAPDAVQAPSPAVQSTHVAEAEVPPPPPAMAGPQVSADGAANSEVPSGTQSASTSQSDGPPSGASTDPSLGPDAPAAIALEKQLVDAGKSVGMYPDDTGEIIKPFPFRQAPNTSGAIIEILPAGTKAKGIDWGGNAWLEVQLEDGRQGFIYGAGIRRLAWGDSQ